MTLLISTPSAPASAEPLLPGYFADPETGAWLTLPPFPVGEIPTIGYGVVRHNEEWLRNHITGEPWQYRPSQVNFILWWYALAGPGPIPHWLYRAGVKRGAKGTGKDPLMATLANAGAVRPDAPGLDGQRAGSGSLGRSASSRSGANSEGQAKDVLMVLNAMVDREMAEALRLRQGHPPDPAGVRIPGRGPDQQRAELRGRSRERGASSTRRHHMKPSNGGDRLAAVGRRNAGKSPGGLARVLEMTNTHQQGEESVAEASYDAWQAQVAGRTRRVDILYDSCEAPPHLSLHDEDQLMEGLRAAYRDAPWVDLERIAGEAQDPRVPIADSIRFYFSSIPTAATAWVDPRKFDVLGSPQTVEDGEPVALFLDCSKSTDATTLAAARISDGHVLALGCWQRPHGDRGTGWLAPRVEVDAVVRAAFARLDVWWFGVDPSPARDDETEASLLRRPSIDQWHRDFRDGSARPPRRRATGPAVGHARHQGLVGPVRPAAEPARRPRAPAGVHLRGGADGPGDRRGQGADLGRRSDDASARAQRPPAAQTSTASAWARSRRDSSQLVDYAVTMVGARLGRRLLLNSGKLRRKRSGKAMF